MHAFLFVILSGIVVTPDRQPVAGATVSIENRELTTAADGRFQFDLPPGTYVLRVSRGGFATQTVSVANGRETTIVLKPALAESIVVSGIRAEPETPVTKTDVSRAQIEKSYWGKAPRRWWGATLSFRGSAGGGGGGAGYSYVTVRGISSTR